VDSQIGAPWDSSAKIRWPRAYRLSSIDMLRGLVVVIMAIEHVRDFFLVAAGQDPMQDPNIPLGLFLTRWITHFCAPVFVLLAGASAGLMMARKRPAALGQFLFKRGDPNPWQWHAGSVMATVIDFLNTTKYPPSLLFLLMTLGPAAMLCAVADRMSGFVKNALVMFGRVPFAFYVAHFFLIHFPERAAGRHPGLPPRSVPDHLFLVSDGVRRVAARRVSRLDAGDRIALPVLRLGRRSEGAPAGLVAQLPLTGLGLTESALTMRP
jgi:uncharacterized membrane protein